GKTDDKLLKITGTAEHDSIVLISHVIEGKGTVYIDGSVVADASGHWVFQMTAPFQPTFGNRIITATATDAAGNTSAASDSYVVN
ncbi:Ig-like domain-containing protein, partial [Rahnella ecdela]